MLKLNSVLLTGEFSLRNGQKIPSHLLYLLFLNLEGRMTKNFYPFL